ncbi:hypothetical protein P7C73_g4119, partial [Tremellales sp. Uapishka_1]
MAPISIIDPYNLTITLLITIGYQCLGFAIAWTLQFDKITDFTGGSNFFIIALITLCTGGSKSYRFIYLAGDHLADPVPSLLCSVCPMLRYFACPYLTYRPPPRNIVASVLVMIWAARLGGFLLFRVLKTGSDTRFDEMRSHFFKFAGFWAGQILWVWTVSLPVVILNSPAVSDPARGGTNPKFGTGRDIAGIILFAIGLFWEALGDIQKFQFKSTKPPKGQPCTKGLWYFSRHPPYFGEILLHWGLWILCLSPAVTSLSGRSSESGASRAQYGAIVAPLFTMLLLLFLSGLPTAEKPAAKKYYEMSYPSDTDSQAEEGQAHTSFTAKNDVWANYKSYLARTSILIPILPALYRPLPEWLKRSVLFDFPMYRFDEEKDGKKV